MNSVTSPDSTAVGGARSLAADTGLVCCRELRPLLRDPFSVVFTLVQPLVFLAFFGPLLDTVAGIGGDSTLQWFVPGIIVMSALFGASATGSNLAEEIASGSYERMLVTPLHRSALLLGRAGKELVPTIAQAVVIMAVVIPFGFDLFPLGATAGLSLIAVFAVGLGALSHALALAVRDNQWMFWAIQQTVLFPLLLLSGILLPIDDAPGWITVLSRINPLTYIVNAARDLFANDFVASTIISGAVASAGVLIVGLAAGLKSVHNSAR